MGFRVVDIFASNLAHVEQSGSKNDPYVELAVNGIVQTTPTQPKRGSEARWTYRVNVIPSECVDIQFDLPVHFNNGAGAGAGAEAGAGAGAVAISPPPGADLNLSVAVFDDNRDKLLFRSSILIGKQTMDSSQWSSFYNCQPEDYVSVDFPLVNDAGVSTGNVQIVFLRVGKRGVGASEVIAEEV